jgi:hypothetical protein
MKNEKFDKYMLEFAQQYQNDLTGFTAYFADNLKEARDYFERYEQLKPIKIIGIPERNRSAGIIFFERRNFVEWQQKVTVIIKDPESKVITGEVSTNILSSNLLAESFRHTIIIIGCRSNSTSHLWFVKMGVVIRYEVIKRGPIVFHPSLFEMLNRAIIIRLNSDANLGLNVVLSFTKKGWRLTQQGEVLKQDTLLNVFFPIYGDFPTIDYAHMDTQGNTIGDLWTTRALDRTEQFTRKEGV